MNLNVGPDATGEFPEESLKILSEIGEWMKKNGDSVCGCGKVDLPKPEWGRFTGRGDRLYLHVLENTLGPLPVPGVPPDRFVRARLLSDGSEVPVSHSWTHADYGNLLFLDLDNDPSLPDETDTVVEVTLKPEKGKA